MRKFLRNLYLTRISFGLAAVVLLCAANSLAQAQPPLVYTVENTGASYPAPVLPDFAHPPINRQMPDPFVFFNGTRDTTWPRSSNTATNGCRRLSKTRSVQSPTARTAPLRRPTCR